MQLLYDSRDDAYHERVGAASFTGSTILAPFRFTKRSVRRKDSSLLAPEGWGTIDKTWHPFHWSVTGPMNVSHYCGLIGCFGQSQAHIQVPSPKTWVLQLDAPTPQELVFPAFVRTASFSWKKGGLISKVKSGKERESEAAEIRRAIG